MLLSGGDYDYTTERSYPGLSLFHRGMDLYAVVSNGDDVWSLKVAGQLQNDTWSNIGVRWVQPNKVEGTTQLDTSDPGGLEVRQTYFLKNVNVKLY